MPVKKNEHDIKAGNIYAIPLSENEYFFFRVILMIDEQCIEPKYIGSESQLTFFESCGLIEVFRNTADTVSGFNDNDIIVPGLFCSFKNFIRNGKWVYAGFKEVVPDKVYFPGFVQSKGFYKALYIRGEVAIEFDMVMKEVETIGIFPSTFPGASLFVLFLYNTGRAMEIPTDYEEVEHFSLSRQDLQFSEHLQAVKSLIGDDVNLSYQELSKKMDFDTARFYAK